MASNLSLFFLVVGFLSSCFFLQDLFSCNVDVQRKEFEQLLKDSGIEEYQSILKDSGCHSAVSFVQKYEDSFLRGEALRVKQFLVLRQWLKKNNLLSEERPLIHLAVRSLGDLGSIEGAKSIVLSDEISLPGEGEERELWLEMEPGCEPWTAGRVIGWSILLVSGVVGVVAMVMSSRKTAARKGRSLLSYVTGCYLSPQKCTVSFDWTDPHPVGSTLTFSVKFVQRNGQPYSVCDADNILIEVTHREQSQKVACSIDIGGEDARVQFSVRRAGEYRIDILLDMAPIRGSPFIRTFLPGPPDPLKTCFVHQCSVVVGSEDIPTQLFVEPRDRYGNHCEVDTTKDPAEEYTVDVVEVQSGRPIPDSFRWECHPLASRLALVLKFPREGLYRAIVSHRGRNIQNGDFHCIVLNKDESYMVQKNVAKKNKCYEVKLVSLNGGRQGKPKKVYCYISPKQLTLKEFMWKFFPKHLITFRLCPSTKFRFQSGRNDLQGEPVLLIEDGCQQEVELVTPERNIIAATFTQFLFKNIGGSETFKDKQDFFYHEVRKFHQKHFHDKLLLKISRENLLESSLKETKNLGVTEWCKNFEITFIGEEGLDWGGLRREWFELLCCALFDPQNAFFHSFKNDNQGLVHPIPLCRRAPHLQKPKWYEFAGRVVGKCLYESALGSSYRQLVKAKFSRSFLAQLIGLSVHYKYFEHDDPELYVSKVKYILENEIEGMGLTFVEELYDLQGQLIQEVELIPNGSSVRVTNENKVEYLNALAQYRLSTSVKTEIEHFLKGLNELIPDNLLCIFDENELELLMCGMGSYSISEFKANHAVSGSSYEFRKVLEWFWIAVSNFTEEEMARLLQFTTGCSQLPPGGFSELSPKFHITAAPTLGNLPTAHTCFNQLCLPDYDSYDHFERALRLAINEGSEGFGMV